MLNIKVFTFSPIQENTYILFNDKQQAIVIDPGCYFPAEQDTLKEFFIKAALKPILLLNTHCHLDHVFGNKFIQDTYGLTLQIHADEEKMLKYAPESGLKWGLPFENYDGNIMYLAEGDIITLGDDSLEIILAPGHSPGHICFYNKAGGYVVAGDVLFRGSIGRTDLPYGSHAQLLKSIEEKLFVLPDETVVYPGHGEKTTIGFEKRNNPFFQ